MYISLRPWQALALAVGGAALAGLQVSFLPLGVLALVSTAPWLVLCLARSRVLSCVSLLVSAYVFFLVVARWLRPVSLGSWLLAPLFFAPFYLVAWAVVRWGRKVLPGAPLFFLWGVALAIAELARSSYSPGQLAVGQIGTSALSFGWLAQAADLVGTCGLTLVFGSAAGIMIEWALLAPTGPMERRAVRRDSMIVALVFLALIGYGGVRSSTLPSVQGPTVAVIQPSVSGWLGGTAPETRLKALVELTLASSPAVDLVAWPENSIPRATLLPTGEVEGLEPVRDVVRRLGVPILCDGPLDVQVTGRRHHVTVLVEPTGRVSVSYKRVLVPWSEYLPFAESLRSTAPRVHEFYRSLAARTNPAFLAMEPSPAGGATTMELSRPDKEFVLATAICYEAICSQRVRELSRGLSNEQPTASSGMVVVNPVNEALLGRAVHSQTLALCRMRAIEGRFGLVRAANNGVSAIIGPRGELRAVLLDQLGRAQEGPGVLVAATVTSPASISTPIAVLGDWGALAMVAATMTFLTLAGVAIARLTAPRRSPAS